MAACIDWKAGKKMNPRIILIFLLLAACRPQCSDTQEICTKSERVKVIESPYATGVAMGVFPRIMGLMTNEHYEEECTEYKSVPDQECLVRKSLYDAEHK